jgi:hypothetical protein
MMGTTVPVAVRRGAICPPPREKAIPASRLEAKPDVISTGFRSLCVGLFSQKSRRGSARGQLFGAVISHPGRPPTAAVTRQDNGQKAKDIRRSSSVPT